MKESLLIFLLASTLSFSTPIDQEHILDITTQQNQEQIYGSDLMTQDERSDYLSEIRKAATAAEQERIRKEHIDRMQTRAKKRGVTLPEGPRESRNRMTQTGGDNLQSLSVHTPGTGK